VRLVAYLRVSSDCQLDSFGLDVQERAIRAWARTAGHRIVDWQRDEGGWLRAISESPGFGKGRARDAARAGDAVAAVAAQRARGDDVPAVAAGVDLRHRAAPGLADRACAAAALTSTCGARRTGRPASRREFGRVGAGGRPGSGPG